MIEWVDLARQFGIEIFYIECGCVFKAGFVFFSKFGIKLKKLQIDKFESDFKQMNLIVY